MDWVNLFVIPHLNSAGSTPPVFVNGFSFHFADLPNMALCKTKFALLSPAVVLFWCSCLLEPNEERRQKKTRGPLKFRLSFGGTAGSGKTVDAWWANVSLCILCSEEWLGSLFPPNARSASLYDTGLSSQNSAVRPSIWRFNENSRKQIIMETSLQNTFRTLEFPANVRTMQNHHPESLFSLFKSFLSSLDRTMHVL